MYLHPSSTVVAFEGTVISFFHSSGMSESRSWIATFILLRRPCSASLCEVFLSDGDGSAWKCDRILVPIALVVPIVVVVAVILVLLLELVFVFVFVADVAILLELVGVVPVPVDIAVDVSGICDIGGMEDGRITGDDVADL